MYMKTECARKLNNVHDLTVIYENWVFQKKKKKKNQNTANDKLLYVKNESVLKLKIANGQVL